MNHPFNNSAEHLLAELQRLNVMVWREVQRLRVARILNEDQFRGLYISEAQVDALLTQPPWRESREEPHEVQAFTDIINAQRVEIDARVEAASAAGIRLPLPRLAEVFGLTPFEIETLLIALAPEFDLRFEVLYSYAQNDVTRKRPTVDLALRLLCGTTEERFAYRALFTADSALFRHQLVRLCDDPQDREPPLLARFLKADARVTEYLLGSDRLDDRLKPFTRLIAPTQPWDALPLAPTLKEQIQRAWQAQTAQEHFIFFLEGSAGVGRQSVAEALCASNSTPLLVADLSTAEPTLPPLAMLLRREAMLQSAALYLANFEAYLTDEPRVQQITRVLRDLLPAGFPLFIGSEKPWQPPSTLNEARWLKFVFQLPDYTARLQLWQQAFEANGHRSADGINVSALANKFTLSAGQIQEAVREAANLTLLRRADDGHWQDEELHAAARSQSNQALRQLAQKIEPHYTWADIVLPTRVLQQLRAVSVAVKQRAVVHDEWGFAARLALSQGLNILFAGPSGTGKTMSAQIIASDLQLDLYRIDLSSVVSKYIGETEKNLSRIFREAQSSNAILFFDEADALFGKRSEVKDAHDRYANIEVAYLLQKMEEYDGIVILATNLRRNLDEAFARRLHHVIEFPAPNAAERERIWHRILPPSVPMAEDVDVHFLAAQFDLSGGNIRNIALAAAFMAAEADEPIRMEHLIRATADELKKQGKAPSRDQFRHYYELIRERN